MRRVSGRRDRNINIELGMNVMNTLLRTTVGLMVATALLAPAWPAFSADREEKVKLEDCPAAVQKTIKDNAGSGKIVEVEKETKKDGSVVYEAEVKKTNGRMVDIEVAEDGRLIEVEEDDEDGDGDDE
jgi:uncharacterized membrane protein YkoI